MTTKVISRAHTSKALERRVKRARKEVERDWYGVLLTIVICVLRGMRATSVMIDAVVCTNAE